jgi:GNAT superfamily N-acetyltransferase
MPPPAMNIDVHLEPDCRKVRTLQQDLTARLPAWFGREAANRHYAAQAGILPGWIAAVDGRSRGLLLLKRHGAWSAEIYWMAVDPDYHRCGIGKALLTAVTRLAVGEGRKLMFAFTMGPDSGDEHYRRTRQFYERQGFFLGLAAHETSGQEPDSLAYYVKLIGT